MSASKTETKPSTDLTVNEFVESLTGHEEDAILQHFGADVLVLLSTRPMTCGRSLIYVDRKRQGDDNNAAVAHAKGLPMRQVDAYFTPEPIELDDDEPESEPGKGDSRPG